MAEFSPKVDEKVELKVPPLEELAAAIHSGISQHFKSTEVSVTACPDLSPFGLAFPHFGTHAVIADIGGPGNLYPRIEKEKFFNVNKICSLCGIENADLVIGPGAGPHNHVGCNCELMCNCCVSAARTESFIAKIDASTGNYVQKKIDTNDFALMANLLMTAGAAAKVLHVKASHRTGKANFSDSIRYALNAKYGAQLISLGGAFRINKGKAKLHVMGLDLRAEHTHCYSDHGDAGHYHYDTTPDQVEYEGWFVPASQLFRIDRVTDKTA